MSAYQKILKFARENPVVVWVLAYMVLAALMVVVAVVSTF